METDIGTVAAKAAAICGVAVDEVAAAAWLGRVKAKCREDADADAVVLAAARFAAADAVECDVGFAARMQAGGLGLSGRTAGEAARDLRRAAMRIIAPYVDDHAGVVKAWNS